MSCIGKLMEKRVHVAVLLHQLGAVEQIGFEVSVGFRGRGENASAPQSAAKESGRQKTLERLMQEGDELIDVGITLGAAKSPPRVEVSVDADIAREVMPCRQLSVREVMRKQPALGKPFPHVWRSDVPPVLGICTE